MKRLQKPHGSALATLAAAALLMLPLAGCDQRDETDDRLEEQATEAGEELREAGREVGKTLEVVGERAGEAIEEGRERTGEALERAGQRLQRDEDDDPPTTRPAGTQP